MVKSVITYCWWMIDRFNRILSDRKYSRDLSWHPEGFQQEWVHKISKILHNPFHISICAIFIVIGCPGRAESIIIPYLLQLEGLFSGIGQLFRFSRSTSNWHPSLMCFMICFIDIFMGWNRPVLVALRIIHCLMTSPSIFILILTSFIFFYKLKLDSVKIAGSGLKEKFCCLNSCSCLYYKLRNMNYKKV